MEEFYPEIIRNLPEAEIPIAGVRGHLMQSEHGQLVFFDISETAEVPPHTHGAQWGVVLDGEMELTIGDETRLYRKGDTYLIPAGVTHSATFKTRCKILDLFADKDRYKVKSS
jgi:quercetin dioxygenase-like cupin family protein